MRRYRARKRGECVPDGRNGGPGAKAGFRGTATERFWDKVNRIDCSCWEWLGARGQNGYGHFAPTRRKTLYAHRYVFAHIYGRELLNGWEVDHLCRNRACVRLDHLQAVPNGFNRMQGNTTRVAQQKAKAARGE